MKIYLFLLAIILLILDQASKYYVATYFGTSKFLTLLPFLSIYYSENYGVAFSFLQNFNHLFISLFSIFIISYMSFCLKRCSSIFTLLGYTMIISGAIGNLLDRIRLGYVIDFIFFHISDIFSFAIFNLADSFITIGVILIIFYEFLYKLPPCK